MKNQIMAYSKELRLPRLPNTYRSKAIEATKSKSYYGACLLSLLEEAYPDEIKNRKARHGGTVGFPYKKHLEQLKCIELPPDVPGWIRGFASGRIGKINPIVKLKNNLS